MPALDAGADLVITGRVADPSLFLAPIAHRLGWEAADWPRIAAGTLVGHLLECAGQITGGYFADPGYKDVPGLADLGFPFADVRADGSATIGKLPGTGGVVSRATVREQLLYEITDPAAYRTPDVLLDVRGVTVEETGPDRVLVRGGAGRPRPEALKVSVGYHAGHRAEAEISYVGPNAPRRAELAARIVEERLARAGVRPRLDLIGTLPAEPRDGRAGECRLRVAALAPDPGRARRRVPRGRGPLHQRPGGRRRRPHAGRRRHRHRVGAAAPRGRRPRHRDSGGPRCASRRTGAPHCMRSRTPAPATRATPRRCRCSRTATSTIRTSSGS
nr:acyclic terpene utilization AtuA family protein [Actinomadura madurae]